MQLAVLPAWVHVVARCDVTATWFPRFSHVTAVNSAGQHVDGNFVTVLWADGPGLQVPAPSAQLSCDEVKAAGKLMQRRQKPSERPAPSILQHGACEPHT